MEIGKISGGLPSLGKLTEIKNKESAEFGNVLTDFIKQVNTDQIQSKAIVNDFINGEDVELHQVMVAGQKAQTSLDLLMQIRNKTIDMYKELTRMQ